MLLIFLRFLLLPLSFFYGLIIELRNWCYDFGLFKSIKFPVPVISIGNITAGGTGKTPFTIYLAELLRKDHPKIAIVSRGYGRQSKGMQIVSDVQKILLDPSKSGDEPFLIASHLPGVLVVVSEKRSVAINHLTDNYQLDLILMDDAFQHRQVWRDVDIVLINSLESNTSKFMLPSGDLREFTHNLKRADIIVLTNIESSTKLDQYKLTRYVDSFYNCQSTISQLVDIDQNNAGTFDTLNGKLVIAFAGIAHPDNFKNALIDKGILVKGFQSYPDHHNYDIVDFENQIKLCKAEKCQIILCTEKDLVKIARLQGFKKHLKNAGIELFAVRLKLEIKQSDQLAKNIQTFLDKNR